MRHATRHRRAAAAIALGVLAFTTPSVAAPLKTTLTVTTSGGYARLVFAASEFIDASARQADNVLIISFKEPLDVSVVHLAEQASGYIAAARRDPDGKAVRLALEQELTVHAMAAGEKYFVDLLPKSWTGMPPGLPQDVVDELARRAREAEKLLQREQRPKPPLPPIRVHVASEPTFTRYVFDLPGQTTVSANRAKDRLVLNFDAPVTFDLGDAQAALPRSVSEISSEVEKDSALVRFIFADKVDVRTFRDEAGYVVDVVNPKADAAGSSPAQSDMSQGAPLETAPPAMPAGQGAAGQGAAGQGAAGQGAAGQGVENLAAAAAQISAAATAPAAVAVSPPPAAVKLQPPATSNAVLQPVASPAAAKPAIATAAPNSAVQPVAPPPKTNAAPVAAAKPTEQHAAPMPAPAPAGKGNAVPGAAAAVRPPAPPPAAAVAAAKPELNLVKVDTPDLAKHETPPQQAAPAPAKPKVAAAPATAAPDGDAGGKITAELSAQGPDLKLTFAFKAPVGAAVFRRADTLWIVFDSRADIDLAALDAGAAGAIRAHGFTHSGAADVIRLKLDRPRLASVAAEGPVWTVQIGDSILSPTHPLDLGRDAIGPNRESVTIDLNAPQHIYAIADPEVGDRLFVVTALPPARGLLDEQDFVEFRALASVQGLAIEPLADDLAVKPVADRIVVSRPSGLALSAALHTLTRGSDARPATFNAGAWEADRGGSYYRRQADLITAAAEAPARDRFGPRLDLARFYLVRGMYPEAKGVLDVALSDERAGAESVAALVLRAVAEVMMDRPHAALKDLAEPGVGDSDDARLWRALAYAKEGKWAEARQAFRPMETAVATLPAQLQRVALKEEMRSAIEVGDFNGATDDLNDFQTIGIPRDMQPALAVLMGRLAEGLGRKEEALAAYRTAADSWDRPAAAQGQLRETVLRYRLGELKRNDVVSQLESLTTIWRGDETEVEALKVLAHLYTEEGRFRDAFYVMRGAMAARPNSALTHQIQDEAAATFDSLFLSDKGDSLPAIDALALFYDFRELTPIGARGDEMIRRLADRLVAVDLLGQAAELLQYQVDHRLQGAARAQVATRLAVIYLMDRRSDRALAVLRASRTGDLSTDLRDQRLLLEARALSDLGRHELALEVIADVSGRPATRLRADILWAAHRFDDAAEQIELMYGDRYKDFRPLDTDEQEDIMRAEIGYALAGDQLGLGRFRDKYAAKMAATPDAHDFQIASAPFGASADDFAAIAHAAAATATLETFLRDMKARYPDSSALAPAIEPPPPDLPSASEQPPQTRPAFPDVMPVPPARAAGRTAMR